TACAPSGSTVGGARIVTILAWECRASWQRANHHRRSVHSPVNVTSRAGMAIGPQTWSQDQATVRTPRTAPQGSMISPPRGLFTTGDSVGATRDGLLN